MQAMISSCLSTVYILPHQIECLMFDLIMHKAMPAVSLYMFVQKKPMEQQLVIRHRDQS